MAKLVVNSQHGLLLICIPVSSLLV